MKLRVAVLAAAVFALSACDIQGILMPPVPPPPVDAGVFDRTGDASGPPVVYDVKGVSSRRTGEAGSQTYTTMRLSVPFASPSDVRLPPPGSHPSPSGDELAWMVCLDPGTSAGYVINPAVPDITCDYLVDGGALTAGQGGTGRLPDGTYRLVRVTSASPLAVADTGARATAEITGGTLMIVTVDIRPLGITSGSPAVGMIFAAGNRNGGPWNITDFVPDGAVITRL